MRRITIACLAVTSLIASDAGLPPRSSSSDYPVHQSTESATFAAALVRPEQVKKIFSNEIANKWVIVEVGIYPLDGHTVDVDFFDFALKVGDDFARPGTPDEVASVWSDKGGSYPGRGPRVTTETGVVYSSGNDPVYGRTHGWGTYTGVGVETGDPRGSTVPPPPSGPDPAVIAAKARDRGLPQGQANHPVAGYLYFPVSPKKIKTGSVDLTYSRDTASIHLAVPAK